MKKEILDIACSGDLIAVNKNTLKLVPCSSIQCKNCFFSKTSPCQSSVQEWVNSEYSEYVEPEIDWNKVPVDTPIYVKDLDYNGWIPRHFAGITDSGLIQAWNNGVTSHTTVDNGTRIWNCVKITDGIDCSKWYKDEEEYKNE